MTVNGPQVNLYASVMEREVEELYIKMTGEVNKKKNKVPTPVSPAVIIIAS